MMTEHFLDPIDVSMPRRLASTRASKTLSQMDLSSTSFSLASLDQIGHRSPNRVLDNSGVLSQPLRMEDLLDRPIVRAYNDPRAVTYARLDIREIASPMTTASLPIKPPLSDGPTKPLGSLAVPQLPTRGVSQPSNCPVEHLTVEGFLHSLGLDKYVILFKAGGDGRPGSQRAGHTYGTKEKDYSCSPFAYKKAKHEEQYLKMATRCVQKSVSQSDL